MLNWCYVLRTLARMNEVNVTKGQNKDDNIFFPQAYARRKERIWNITSEFNVVYFSEMGEAEATHSRDPRKINLGGETCMVSEPLNSCYILPIGIDF